MVNSYNGGQSAALIHADHPWGEEALAALYDVFPFDGDLPFYRELAVGEGGRVFELACGSGRVLVPLAEAGNTIVGVDISPHMLAQAQRKLDLAGRDTAARATLLEGDMRAVRQGEQFDLAIIAVKSFAYLTTTQDQLRALATVAAHLRPGGLFAIDLLNPSLEWLAQPPGSLRQDLAHYVAEQRVTVVRTEAAVSTDFAAQIRVIRSGYEIVGDDGSVRKRFVEWPYRYTYRFEAEHLLSRAGFEVEAVYGGYRREPFTGDSRVMLFLARRRR